MIADVAAVELVGVELVVLELVDSVQVVEELVVVVVGIPYPGGGATWLEASTADVDEEDDGAT